VSPIGPTTCPTSPGRSSPTIPSARSARFGNRFANVRPPGLYEVASALARWDGVTAFVELKRASIRKFGREVVLNRVLKEIAPILDRCVLISFDLPSPQDRAGHGPRTDRLGTHELRRGVTRRSDRAQAGVPVRESREAAGRRVAALARSWSWAIYEVRDLRTAQRLHDRGARFVETMTVRGLMKAFEESRRQW
jgi:hypothetical protein